MINSKVTSLLELREYLKYKSDMLDTWLKLHNFRDLKWIDIFTELLNSVNRPDVDWLSIYKWLVQNPIQRGSIIDDEQRWVSIGKGLNGIEQQTWWRLIIQEFKHLNVSRHEKELVFEKFITEALNQNIEISFLESFYTQIPELTHVYAYYFYTYNYPNPLEKLIKQSIYNVNYDHLKTIQHIVAYWSNADFILKKNCSTEIKKWYMQQFIEFSKTEQFITRPPDIRLVNRLEFTNNDNEYMALSVYLKSVNVDLSEIPASMLKWMMTEECVLSLSERAKIFENSYNYWTPYNIEMFQGIEKAILIKEFIKLIHEELGLDGRIERALYYNSLGTTLKFLDKLFPEIKDPEIKAFAFMFPEMEILFKNFENTITMLDINNELLIEKLIECIRLFNVEKVELPFMEL